MHNPTLEDIREHYYQYKVWIYSLNHPNVPYAKVKKYARVAWRKKLERLRERGILNDNNQTTR